MYDNTLNLSKIFKRLTGQDYCLIKTPECFPSYIKGTDLDVFCLNTDNFIKELLAVLNGIISSNISISITNIQNQIHVDVLKNNILIFRFDLYSKLPHYNNINIKSSYFLSVIENKNTVVSDNFEYFVPSAMDDIIIRYIEYHEYYAIRPDKIKHIHYIQTLIDQNGILHEKFLNRLHYFTEIPNVNTSINKPDNYVSSFCKYSFYYLKKTIRYYMKNGLAKTLLKIRKKIFA